MFRAKMLLAKSYSAQETTGILSNSDLFPITFIMICFLVHQNPSDNGSWWIDQVPLPLTPSRQGRENVTSPLMEACPEALEGRARRRPEPVEGVRVKPSLF